MSEPALPKCVLFDLGGVIIDVDMGSVVATTVHQDLEEALGPWHGSRRHPVNGILFESCPCAACT